MKQLPGRKNDAIIRVQMDAAELHKVLDPILKEVNSLRARVAELETCRILIEAFMDVSAQTDGEITRVLTVLVADLNRRQDDGR